MILCDIAGRHAYHLESLKQVATVLLLNDLDHAYSRLLILNLLRIWHFSLGPLKNLFLQSDLLDLLIRALRILIQRIVTTYDAVVSDLYLGLHVQIV